MHVALHRARARRGTSASAILDLLVRHVLSLDKEAAKDVFNAKDGIGKRPVFYSLCPEAIELSLASGLLYKMCSGQQTLYGHISDECLLRHCSKENILTPAIVRALKHRVASCFGDEYLFEVERPEIIEVLLEEKGLLDRPSVPSLKTEVGAYGWTLLHECVNKGVVTQTILRALRHQVNTKFVPLISRSQKKADQYIRGKTPVFLAEKSDVVEMFLNENMEELKLEQGEGWTLLHECFKKHIVTPNITRSLEHQLFRVEQPEILEALLSEKPEGLPLRHEGSGRTLLQECARKGIVTPGLIRVAVQ